MTTESYLLDTQILLWDLAGDPRLSPEHDRILSGDAPKFLSIASLWEIAVKVRIGKLRMPDKLLEALWESDISLLSVRTDHVMHVAKLPELHGDPFDLLIIAQAQIEGLTLMTADATIKRYDVRTV